MFIRLFKLDQVELLSGNINQLFTITAKHGSFAKGPKLFAQGPCKCPQICVLSRLGNTIIRILLTFVFVTKYP